MSKGSSESKREKHKFNVDPGESTLPSVAGMGGNAGLDYLNITPMIDVMLVILIIFMVITPEILSHSVTLPRAVSSVPEKQKRVTLVINKKGQFFMHHIRQPIPLSQLTSKLKQAYSTRPGDHILYLKADERVQYSVVLTAINSARTAGVTRIGAITNSPKKAKSNNK